MDGTWLYDRQGLATTYNTTDAEVGSETRRTAARKAKLRLLDRRQDDFRPLIVPPDRFYLTRDVVSDSDEYWTTKPDPDGNLRNLDTDNNAAQYVVDVSSQLRYLQDKQSTNLLDVGCGLGWFLQAARFVPSLGYLAGTETCPIAIKRVTELGFDVNQNYRNNSFDCIRVNHVIEHIKNPKHALSEWTRLLSKGGLLIVATPDFGSPAAARFGPNYRMLHDPTHCSLFTQESLFRMLRYYGYDIDHVEYPFPTRYATHETMDRWLTATGVSPPWPGNWLTVYATKQESNP